MAVAMRKPSSRTGAEFETYWANKSIELRDRLVVAHMPLVKQVTHQFVRSTAQRDDLEQVGYLGLIKAVERFDPGLHVPFDAYARVVIAGEISHYLRDVAPTLRLPRWYRTLNRRMHEAHDKLTARLQREPTTEELAEQMNVTPEGVREIARLRETYNLATLSDEPGTRQQAQVELIRSRRYQTFSLPVEDRIVLDKAIERLADVERRLIHLFFYQELTQTEIARRLGFSQKHISRLLARSLRKLKEDLR